MEKSKGHEPMERAKSESERCLWVPGSFLGPRGPAREGGESHGRVSSGGVTYSVYISEN